MPKLMKTVSGADGQDPDHLLAAAERFTLQGRVEEIRAHGSGNVHDTFLVIREGADEPCFILQRLNTYVFPRPELVLKNMRIVTAHIRRRVMAYPSRSRAAGKSPACS